MKQITLPLAGTIAFIILVGLFVKNPDKFVKNKQNTDNQKIVTVKDIEVNVLVSDTPEKRKVGLSNKSFLAETEGMIFVFESKDVKPTFWMKDMLIPIDIIWINDEKIVQIDKNISVPQKNTLDKDLSTFSSEDLIDYVLEVNSGFSDKYKIEVGDSVDLSSIK